MALAHAHGFALWLNWMKGQYTTNATGSRISGTTAFHLDCYGDTQYELMCLSLELTLPDSTLVYVEGEASMRKYESDGRTETALSLVQSECKPSSLPSGYVTFRRALADCFR